MAQQAILVFPEYIEQRVGAAMIRGRENPQDEALGFLLCRKPPVQGGAHRYVVEEWLVPEPGECGEQFSGGISLSPAAHHAFLDRMLASGLHPVHLHTHPGQNDPVFSSIDDRFEADYASAMARLPGNFDLISGVYNFSMSKSRFRIWSNGEPRSILVQQSWIDHLPETVSSVGNEDRTRMFDRQQVFGDDVQRKLGSLTVGLVGAGGLGSMFAEYLSRLGIKNWVIIDPDRLEITNLNRAPFANEEMVAAGANKVDHVSNLVYQFWGTLADVSSIRSSFPDSETEAALAPADILAVATDNHYSRLEVQKLGLKLGKPVLSMGTFIDKRDDDAVPRIFGRVTLPPLAGGWCLACGGVVNLKQVAIEQADPVTTEFVDREGYLPGVDAPAVYWVNGATAGMAAGVVHGLAAGFGVGATGNDYVIDYAQSKWLTLDHELNYDCYFCGVGESFGISDRGSED